MKTILVCNQKGGVGKSLMSDELAFSLARSGIPTSFCDLDTQGGTIHGTDILDDAQVTILDTPGALQEGLSEWAKAADVVVIPTRPTPRNIEPMIRTRSAVWAAHPNVPIIYVVNGWNRFKASRDFVEWFTRAAGPDARIMTIPQAEAFVQAEAKGVSVIDVAPRSTAAHDVVMACNAVRQAIGIAGEPWPVQPGAATAPRKVGSKADEVMGAGSSDGE